MPKYKKVDHDEKLKVIDLHNQRHKPYAIRRKIAEEKLHHLQGKRSIIIKQYITGLFNPAHQQVNAPRPILFQAIGNQEVDTVKQVFRKKHNSSARDVLRELNTNRCNISLSTARRVIDVAGFVATKPRYYQLIREPNKEARVAFCKALIDIDEQFEDVVFTDESFIQLHYNKPVAYRQKDVKPMQAKAPTEGSFVGRNRQNGTHSAACLQWHYGIRILYQRDLEKHAQAVPGERLSRWSPLTTGK